MNLEHFQNSLLGNSIGLCPYSPFPTCFPAKHCFYKDRSKHFFKKYKNNLSENKVLNTLNIVVESVLRKLRDWTGIPTRSLTTCVNLGSYLTSPGFIFPEKTEIICTTKGIWGSHERIHTNCFAQSPAHGKRSINSKTFKRKLSGLFLAFLWHQQ